MSEQDRYIPGVPCWIDTTQPDPAAAAAFYGGLFGWELEDVMPPGVAGQLLHRAAAAAATWRAVELAAGGRARHGGLEHLRLGRGRRRDRREGPRGRRHRADGADRRRRRGAHGGLRRPGGRAFSVWQAGAPRRRRSSTSTAR